MAEAQVHIYNEILTLTRQKVELIHELKAATNKLVTYVDIEKIDQLVELIETRQGIMDSIDVLDEKITSLERELQKLVGAASLDEWKVLLSKRYTNLHKQRQEIGDRLQDIMEVNSKLSGQLQGGLEALIKKMVAFQAVKTTASAYKKTPTFSGGVFVDKKK